MYCQYWLFPMALQNTAYARGTEGSGVARNCGNITSMVMLCLKLATLKTCGKIRTEDVILKNNKRIRCLRLLSPCKNYS